MKKGNGLAVIKAKNKTSKICLAFSKFFSLTLAVGSMAFLFAIFFLHVQSLLNKNFQAV